jgi:hypothetical protein
MCANIPNNRDDNRHFPLFPSRTQGATMEISEAEKLAAQLGKDITVLLQAYEKATGLIVHSVPIAAATKSTPVTARVKVQLP